MTDEAVQISITIKVAKREQKIERKIKMDELEETIQEIAVETGQEALGMGIKELDDRIAARIPQGWRNVGTEERWLVSSIGAMRYKRRIYLDVSIYTRKCSTHIHPHCASNLRQQCATFATGWRANRVSC